MEFRLTGNPTSRRGGAAGGVGCPLPRRSHIPHYVRPATANTANDRNHGEIITSWRRATNKKMNPYQRNPISRNHTSREDAATATKENGSRRTISLQRVRRRLPPHQDSISPLRTRANTSLEDQHAGEKGYRKQPSRQGAFLHFPSFFSGHKKKIIQHTRGYHCMLGRCGKEQAV